MRQMLLLGDARCAATASLEIDMRAVLLVWVGRLSPHRIRCPGAATQLVPAELAADFKRLAWGSSRFVLTDALVTLGSSSVHSLSLRCLV